MQQRGTYGAGPSLASTSSFVASTCHRRRASLKAECRSPQTAEKASTPHSASCAHLERGLAHQQLDPHKALRRAEHRAVATDNPDAGQRGQRVPAVESLDPCVRGRGGVVVLTAPAVPRRGIARLEAEVRAARLRAVRVAAVRGAHRKGSATKRERTEKGAHRKGSAPKRGQATSEEGRRAALTKICSRRSQRPSMRVRA